MAEQWYYRMLGEQFGPVSESVLQNLIARGTLGTSDEIRCSSDEDWQAASTLGMSSSSHASSTADEAASLDLDAMLSQPTAAAPAESTTGDSGELNLEAMLASPAPGARQKPDPNSWYYRVGGQRLGPFDFDTLFEHAAEGRFCRFDEIRSPGTDEWVEAQTILGLFPEPEADLDALLVDEEPLPASQAASEPAPRLLWYYRVLNQEMGPVDFEGLFDLVMEGNLRADDDIRESDSSQWQRADSLVGLFPDDLSSPSQANPAEAEIAESFDQSDEEAEDAEWYFKMDDQELGPVTFERLMQLAQNGRLNRTDPIRLTKLGHWMDAESMVGLFPEEPEPVEPPPAEATPPASSVPDRPDGDADDWAAAVLSEPAPTPSSPEPDFTPAATASAMPTTPSRPAAGMGGAAPVQRPTFTAPPKASRKSSSGGGFSLPSGLGDSLSDPKVLGVVGAVVLVAALFFIPWGDLFGAGADDLIVQLDEIWGQVKALHEKEAPDDEWTALSGQVSPKLAEIAQTATDRGAGATRPALQIALVLASQNIPKILETKMETSPTQIRTVDNYFTRVKEL